MRQITVAGLQLGFSGVRDADIAMTAVAVREAAAAGAQVILPPELFEGHYFCRHEDEGLFANALPLGKHPAVAAMQQIALETKTYHSDQLFRKGWPAPLQQPRDDRRWRQRHGRLSQKPYSRWPGL